MAAPNFSGGIVEFFQPGDHITFTVDEALGVTGGQMVTTTGDRVVSAAGAGDTPTGVALHDAADGEIVTVASEGTWPLTASGAVAAGDLVITGAAGKVATDNTPALEAFVGIALEDIADTATGPVQLRL